MAIVQGVYSDVVEDGTGRPVPGAAVALYPVLSFGVGVLPSSVPGFAATATATTDATGSFSLRGLPADDYHVLVQYAPAGGTALTLWRYNVPVGPAGLALRSYKGRLGAAIPRTLARLLAGGTVTICCIGDGVTVGYNATGTVGGGWVARLAARIAAAFPAAGVTRYDPSGYGTTFDAPIPSWTAAPVQAQGSGASVNVINAGVTGDTVLRCIRRLGNFTSASWSPAPDLYVVMLGLGEMTTDTTRAATAADFASHLGGLVNLLRANGAEGVIGTPHANASVANLDDYANAARGVAAATASGLVDVRQLWLDHYLLGAPNDGYDPWLNTASGDHTNPTDAGHQAIGDEVFRLFDGANELPVLGPAGVGRELERVRLLNTAPSPPVFTGTWTALANANYASGREYTTSTPGDKITFAARFPDLYMLAGRWHAAGQVTATVDGALAGTYDLYRANPASTADLADYHGAIAPQERIALGGPYQDAVHSVTLTLAATRNQASTGNVWRFDGVELVRLRQAGQAVESVAPLQRVHARTGAVSFVAAASPSTTGSLSQSFPNGAPQVVATVDWNGNLYCCAVSSVATGSFQVTVFTRDGSSQTASITVHWLAIG